MKAKTELKQIKKEILYIDTELNQINKELRRIKLKSVIRRIKTIIKNH
jgi:outer membrane lipopolysaccharide assembly protein LptE/RlpB